MIVYLIESTLCLTIMLLVYRLILSKTSLHQLKRFYLLACLLLPLALPLLQVEVYYGDAPVVTRPIDFYQAMSPNLELNVVPFDQPLEAESTTEPETEHKQAITDWSFWVLALYLLIAALLFIRFFANIYRIGHLAKKLPFENHNGFKIILLEGKATPYSFFSLIFIGKDDYKNETAREHLLSHELTHARHWHSADILILELLKIILWFNPLYLLLGKSIRLNHEYIADSQVLTQFGDRRTYQKLILNFASRTRNYTPLVSPSDFSFIKNRFSMMHKSTPQKVAAIRILLLLTAIAGTFFSMSVELKPRPAVFTGPVQADISSVASTTPAGIPIDSIKYSANILTPGTTSFLTLDDYYPGIDITAQQGRTVIATADGIVEVAGRDDQKYGYYVLISHDDQVKTLYASLSEVKVKAGQKVLLGELLGTTGITMPTSALSGRVNRVHYAVSKSGKWVDPYTYINLSPKNANTNAANDVGTIIPWAYPRALDVSIKPNNRPDISPIDVGSGEYMAYTGMVSGDLATKSSIYDSVLGTEFFSVPQTSVKATANGTVTEVVRGHERYGTYVKIRHDDIHETMYAKLDKVLVEPGQTLNKGETIGSIGKDNEMFGRLHYKVLRNGKFMMAGQYTSGASPQGARLKLLAPQNQNIAFNWNFPSGFAYKSISIDREKAIFTERSGTTITKKAAELSDAQKKALLGLAQAPYPQQARRPVPKEVYERWHNPKVYQIRIDGEVVANSEMTKFQPSDFVHSWWVVVGKSTKARKGYAFELSLQTQDYYEQQKNDKQAHMNKWIAQTKERLSILKEF